MGPGHRALVLLTLLKSTGVPTDPVVAKALDGLRKSKIAKVEGTTLVPLSQIEQRFTELDANQTIYLHCKAGVRSLKALGFLREQGFKYLKSVKGGITAWSEEIDPNVPKY
jgi:rhodanese-related sulfurtransferase